MRKLAEGILGDPEMAADVVHDGFIIILRSISSLRDPSCLEPWMATVVRRLALKSIAEMKRHREVPFDDAFPEPEDRIYENDSDISWEELAQIIDSLPRGYRDVFRLSVLDGLSHGEIGKLLGIAPKTSSSQLYRAKILLRRLIADRRMNLLLLGGFISIGGVWLLYHAFRGGDEHEGHFQSIAEVPEYAMRQDKEAGGIRKGLSGGQRNVEGRSRRPLLAEDGVNTGYEPLSSVDSIPHDGYTDPDTISVLPSRNEQESPLVAEEPHEKVFDPAPILLPSRTSGPGWTVSASYEGAYGADAEGHRIGLWVKGDEIMNEDIGDTIRYDISDAVRHHAPLVAGISLSHRLDSRWSLETGIRYTRLRSDSLSSCEYWERTSRQTIHYIGIPIKVSYRLFTVGGFTAYCQAGFGVDFPVNGKRRGLTVDFRPEADKKRIPWQIRLHAPVQWSAEVGIGIEYRFAEHVGIFAEPSFRYWFNPESGVVTVRQDSPAVFTVPFGIRFTW